MKSRYSSIIMLLTLLLVFVLPSSCMKVFQIRSYVDKNAGDESFIYFTDPHLSRKSEKVIHDAFNALQLYSNEFSCEFCLCGGDWLCNNETYAEACNALDIIDQTSKVYFPDNYYPVLGNHDTNYQGKMYESSALNTGRMTESDINVLMFSEFGQAYYSFETDSTMWFVLDTGIDWEVEMTDYRWEQLTWLGQNLQSCAMKHVVIVLHIFANYDAKGKIVVQPMAEHAMELAAACNAKTQVQLNNVGYDFKDSVGVVAFFLCGHNHVDYVLDTLSVPVICTRRFESDGTYSFDICDVNWESGMLTMKRVGEGVDRIINIINE